MRLRSRPLLVGNLDEDLYVPRPDLERELSQAVRDERNVLLVGERGAGKTTLLRRVIVDSPQHDFAIVDAGLASTVHELLGLIRRALGDPTAAQASDADDPVDLLDAVARLPTDRERVLVIDGPLDPDVGYILFGRLRDALWRLPFTWLVSATPDEVGALRTPPADAFWSLVLEVGNLDSDQIEQLLSRALEHDELERVRAGGEMPIFAPARHVVRWAQDVLDGRAPIRDAFLDRQADQLGRQAVMALSELRALDRPAAAGDDELLRRLGWTRANAARWLSRMEAAGILRSFVGVSAGQGRPPKLYEPVRDQ